MKNNKLTFTESIQMLKRENSTLANEVIKSLVEVKSAINCIENRIDELFDAIIKTNNNNYSKRIKTACDACTNDLKCASHFTYQDRLNVRYSMQNGFNIWQ